MKFRMLPWRVGILKFMSGGILKFMIDLVFTMNVQGRELRWFCKTCLYHLLLFNTYELSLFQTLYDSIHNQNNQTLHFVTSLNDLDLVLRPQGYGKSRNYSVVKWHEVTKTFAMVDCVHEITAWNSRKCSEYGLFEHLLLIVWAFALLIIAPSHRNLFPVYCQNPSNTYRLLRSQAVPGLWCHYCCMLGGCIWACFKVLKKMQKFDELSLCGAKQIEIKVWEIRLRTEEERERVRE